MSEQGRVVASTRCSAGFDRSPLSTPTGHVPRKLTSLPLSSTSPPTHPLTMNLGLEFMQDRERSPRRQPLAIFTRHHRVPFPTSFHRFASLTSSLLAPLVVLFSLPGLTEHW